MSSKVILQKWNKADFHQIWQRGARPGKPLWSAKGGTSLEQFPKKSGQIFPIVDDDNDCESFKSPWNRWFVTMMTIPMTMRMTMTMTMTMGMIVSEPGTLGLFPASCGKTCPGSIYDPHQRNPLHWQMDKSNDVHREILLWQMDKSDALRNHVLTNRQIQ